jgi:two-component sensor histidine kinase
VEHGLAGREGTVVIEADRTEEALSVSIVDNGAGLPGGDVGEGLGTQIVRTLIEGELSGSIEWESVEAGGTKVQINIPLKFVAQGLV